MTGRGAITPKLQAKAKGQRRSIRVASQGAQQVAEMAKPSAVPNKSTSRPAPEKPAKNSKPPPMRFQPIVGQQQMMLPIVNQLNYHLIIAIIRHNQMLHLIEKRIKLPHNRMVQ